MNAQTEKWFQEHRLTVIVGHSGSGKTELSVNLALWLAHTGQKTALADLDVVNPYFRSRERADLLDENGIRLITSCLYGCGFAVDAGGTEYVIG